jgi:hypothetical protein
MFSNVNEAIGKVRNSINKDIRTMSAAQLDGIKSMGSEAQKFLEDDSFKKFVNLFEAEKLLEIVSVNGYSEIDNAKRIALTHNLNGIEEFVSFLKKKITDKDKVVSLQNGPTE